MLYYKVVRVWNNEFYSLATFGRYCLKYKLNEIIKPKIGKLFVVDTLLNSKNISRTMGGFNYDCRIFECGVTNPIKMDYLASPCDFDIEWFWNNKTYEDNRKISQLWQSQCGTHGCDSVTLTKLIQ